MYFLNGIIIICITIVLVIIVINYYIKTIAQKRIIDEKALKELAGIDCIIILGAAVRNNRPSRMLEDRLKRGIELYKEKISNKIIMSGDHGKIEYNEVKVMKEYAINNGIPSKDIFMDHAGFSTYESIYRAKEIFEAKKIIVVTQKYHLYRAIYISCKLSIEAYGAIACSPPHAGDIYRGLREILARNKDFIKCIIKPKPTYLGDKISIKGNGDITND